jgi:hypothetical protein
MAVKELPLVWRTCDAEIVTLSEGGAVAAFNGNDSDDDDEEEFKGETLVTSGVELTTGKHYWEVEKLNFDFFVGIARPNLDPNANITIANSTDGWFIWTSEGGLYGNGKDEDDRAGDIDVGDRAGVLLDLDEGSLRFFKNGVQHGPGYPAGSVTGPVVCALELYGSGNRVRLLPQDTDHALLQ